MQHINDQLLIVLRSIYRTQEQFLNPVAPRFPPLSLDLRLPNPIVVAAMGHPDGNITQGPKRPEVKITKPGPKK